MTGKAAKAKPLIKTQIQALLGKTVDNGCTVREALAAYEKAEELTVKYDFDRTEFIWPEKPAVTRRSESEPKGVGKMARDLLTQHRDWSHQKIADQINVALGSHASAASFAWYAAKMRKEGLDVSRTRKADTQAI